jgi:hypothetical protein
MIVPEPAAQPAAPRGGVIPMAMTRDQAGRLIVRHEGPCTVALNYPAGPGFSVTTLIPPRSNVVLGAFETRRNPEEDARFDAHWAAKTAAKAAKPVKPPAGELPPRGKAGPLAGGGATGNLRPHLAPGGRPLTGPVADPGDGQEN